MDEAADSLFFNGRISTLNRSQPEVQALAVKHGLILGQHPAH
jgi:predicted amidohydrolase YtcJ